MPLVAAIGLAGCPGVPLAPHDARLDYTIPDGSQLVIHEPLDYPAGSGRVWVQDGVLVEHHTLDRSRVHCGLRLKSPAEGAYTLSPRAVDITGTASRSEPVTHPTADARPDIQHQTVLRLAGDAPVRDLTCTRRTEEIEARPIGLEAMTTALEPLISIQ